MWKCPKCWEANPESAVDCSHCGESCIAENPEMGGGETSPTDHSSSLPLISSPPTNSNTLSNIVSVVVALILLSVGAVMLVTIVVVAGSMVVTGIRHVLASPMLQRNLHQYESDCAHPATHEIEGPCYDKRVPIIWHLRRGLRRASISHYYADIGATGQRKNEVMIADGQGNIPAPPFPPAKDNALIQVWRGYVVNIYVHGVIEETTDNPRVIADQVLSWIEVVVGLFSGGLALFILISKGHYFLGGKKRSRAR